MEKSSQQRTLLYLDENTLNSPDFSFVEQYIGREKSLQNLSPKTEKCSYVLQNEPEIYMTTLQSWTENFKRDQKKLQEVNRSLITYSVYTL